MGFLRRLFGKRDDAAAGAGLAETASVDRKRLLHMPERAPSFSLIAIPGEASQDIQGLLTACDYVLRSTTECRGPFSELYADLSHDGDDRHVVRKAWFRASGYTVLVDPEMVLFTETERLAEISRKAGGAVIAAIWERGSETVVLAEIGPEGLRRQSSYCQGIANDDEHRGGHPQLAENPTREGLLAALAVYGLPDDEMFGHVEATVVELQE